MFDYPSLQFNFPNDSDAEQFGGVRVWTSRGNRNRILKPSPTIQGQCSYDKNEIMTAQINFYRLISLNRFGATQSEARGWFHIPPRKPAGRFGIKLEGV